jgi:periplasmic protein TonB
MNRYLLFGVLIALFLHGVALGSLVYIGVLLADDTPPLVIDFSIEKTWRESPSSNNSPKSAQVVPEKIEKQPEMLPTEALLTGMPEPMNKSILKKVEIQKQPTEKHEVTQSPPRKISAVKIKRKLVSEELRPAVVQPILESVATEVPSKVINTRGKASVVPTAGALTAIAPSAPQDAAAMDSPTTDNVEDTVASLQKQYVTANFSNIKDAVQLKTRYPRMARKMGWEGKVVLSFIISTNGYIEGVQVIKSCGFKALDQNAIKTLKQCAPFPRPQVRAELTLPITYHLK